MDIIKLVENLSNEMIADKKTMEEAFNKYLGTPVGILAYTTINNTKVDVIENLDERNKLIRIFDLENNRYIDLILSYGLKGYYRLEFFEFKKEFNDKELKYITDGRKYMGKNITDFQIEYIGYAKYKVAFTTDDSSGHEGFIIDIVNYTVDREIKGDTDKESYLDIATILIRNIRSVNGLGFDLTTTRYPIYE